MTNTEHSLVGNMLLWHNSTVWSLIYRPQSHQKPAFKMSVRFALKHLPEEIWLENYRHFIYGINCPIRKPLLIHPDCHTAEPLLQCVWLLVGAQRRELQTEKKEIKATWDVAAPTEREKDKTGEPPPPPPLEARQESRGATTAKEEEEEEKDGTVSR